MRRQLHSQQQQQQQQQASPGWEAKHEAISLVNG
jgi:hypothetical protein